VYSRIPWGLTYLLILVSQLLVLAEMTFFLSNLEEALEAPADPQDVRVCTPRIPESTLPAAGAQSSLQTALYLNSSFLSSDSGGSTPNCVGQEGHVLQVGLGCPVTSPAEFPAPLRMEIDLSGQPHSNLACMSGDES